MIEATGRARSRKGFSQLPVDPADVVDSKKNFKLSRGIHAGAGVDDHEEQLEQLLGRLSLLALLPQTIISKKKFTAGKWKRLHVSSALAWQTSDSIVIATD